MPREGLQFAADPRGQTLSAVYRPVLDAVLRFP